MVKIKHLFKWNFYFFLVSLFVVTSCKLKSKTELYLELGLNHLDNTILINKKLSDSIYINKLGIIKDNRLNKTNFILKLKKKPSKSYLKNHIVDVEFFVNEKEIKAKKYRLNPEIKIAKNNFYLLTEIKLNKEIIDSVKIILYNNSNMMVKQITIYKVRTNNK